MEFRDIEYFAVLAEHGNVGRAAEALGMSTPALSISLRRLETAMRVKLFTRTPKGLELTSMGSTLLSQVNKLRLAREDVLREATDLSDGRSGHLRIGAGPGACIALLPLVCERVAVETPKVTLKIAVAPIPLLVKSLRDGDTDLAIAVIPAMPLDDLTQEPLYEEEMIVYCAEHHRLAKKRGRVRLADVASEEWASSQTGIAAQELFNRMLQDHGFPPRKVRMEVGSLQIVNHLIATTNLLGFNSRTAVRKATPEYRFAELNIKELTHTRRTALLYRKDGYLSPAARRFIDILKTVAKTLDR